MSNLCAIVEQLWISPGSPGFTSRMHGEATFGRVSGNVVISTAGGLSRAAGVTKNKAHARGVPPFINPPDAQCACPVLPPVALHSLRTRTQGAVAAAAAAAPAAGHGLGTIWGFSSSVMPPKSTPTPTILKRAGILDDTPPATGGYREQLLENCSPDRFPPDGWWRGSPLPSE